MIEVEILTRAGCHLCDEMKEAVTRAARGLDVRLTEIDIDADEELTAKYGHDIPVLFVNGSKAFKYRATAQDLKKRLLMADGRWRHKIARGATRHGRFSQNYFASI